MALRAVVNDNHFGVGDVVNMHQRILDTGGKEAKYRTQIFSGTVIGIRGRGEGKSVVVRRIASQNVGVEIIVPLSSPNLEKIEVMKEGLPGVRHGKLYYIRAKSNREIEKIYSRAKRRNLAKKASNKKASKKNSK